MFWFVLVLVGFIVFCQNVYFVFYFLRQFVHFFDFFFLSLSCLFVSFLWFGWNGCELTMSHLNWLIWNEDFLHDWPTMTVQLQPIFECYRKKIVFFATTRMLMPGLLYHIYTTHNTHTYVIGLVICQIWFWCLFDFVFKKMLVLLLIL